MEKANRWLAEMPEMAVLVDIADTLGRPFRIRGGVARNLVARAFDGEGHAPEHLVDLVDPLSDVDLVVDDAPMLERVFVHIFRRLVLAGFLRWEGMTAAQVAYFDERGPATTLDRVEIEITADGARVVNEDDALRDLNEGILRGRAGAFDEVERAVFALRLARFGAQYGLEIDDELANRVAQFERLEGLPASRDMLRLELAALDVFLNARTSQAGHDWLLSTLNILPQPLWERSRILTRLADMPLDLSARVIVYPRAGRRRPRVRLETDVRTNATIADELTLLPWTPIRLPPFANGGCCPPSDFELGSLVIAWRGVKVPHDEIGIVALAPPADPYELPSRLVFVVPGVVTTHPTVVQRIDWGFARYLAGDGRLVYFGARPEFEPEDES